MTGLSYAELLERRNGMWRRGKVMIICGRIEQTIKDGPGGVCAPLAPGLTPETAEADMHTISLFPIRRSKPVLRPAWSIDHHPFTADDTDISCVHCALPRQNQRHHA